MYVISTKHVSFVKKLLSSKAAGIPPGLLLEENIYGLGSGKKSDILQNLIQTKEINRVGIFIELKERLVRNKQQLIIE